MSLAVRGRAGAAMVAGVAIVLAIDWLAHTTVASLIGAGFVVALASLEFYDLAERKGLSAFKSFGVAAAVTLVLVPSLAASRDASGAVAALLCFVLWWIAFRLILPAQRRNRVDVTSRIALTSIGVVYVGGMASFWMWIRQLPNGLAGIILLIIIAKGGDVMAYFVGSVFGRHKLASSISPNKSVEGAAANVGISMVLALLVTRIPGMPFARPSDALIFGLVVSAAAQIGDLLESKVKRAFGAKDSSHIIPGFGGVLDVIDCLLIAAPVGYLALRLWG